MCRAERADLRGPDFVVPICYLVLLHVVRYPIGRLFLFLPVLEVENLPDERHDFS